MSRWDITGKVVMQIIESEGKTLVTSNEDNKWASTTATTIYESDYSSHSAYHAAIDDAIKAAIENEK